MTANAMYMQSIINYDENNNCHRQEDINPHHAHIVSNRGSYAYVQQDPGKALCERIRIEYAVMEMPGWRWMLLVFRQTTNRKIVQPE